MSQLPAAPSAPLETPPHHHVTVAAVAWSNILEFLHLFKTFRLAINPAKLVVALLAILAIYGSGRLFDLAWGPQVYPSEIERYQTERPEVFRQERDDQIDRRHSDLRLSLSIADDSLTDADLRYYSDHPRAAYGKLRSIYVNEFHASVKHAAADRAAIERERSAGRPTFALPSEKTPYEIEMESRADASKRLLSRMESAQATTGRGIFAGLMAYELKQFDFLVQNTLTFVRVSPEENAVSSGLLSTNPDRFYRSDTIVGCLANMTITAPCWLFSATAPMQWHSADSPATFVSTIKTYAYRLLYLISLVVLASFWLCAIAGSGAIICRLSALEFVGNDKASLAQAVRFARTQFLSFVKAPIMPFVIVLVIGLAVACLGLVGAIPILGEILLGLLFVVFLVAGFVLMLLILGIIGGFNLLYPTLAVEGSDSFDALSRSFAYVYARPWRLAFYTVISLIYGIITFLFVAFAIYVVLAATHTFAGWGTSLGGYNHGWYTGEPKLDTLWPAPQVTRLVHPINWWAMNWSEYIGALFLHGWVFLLISGLAAYVISFYHSANTIIYFLLRRSVDGQSLSEVYYPEESAPPAAVAAVAVSVPTSPSPPAAGASPAPSVNPLIDPPPK